MGFIRFFDGSMQFHSWADAVPELKTLLGCLLESKEVAGDFPRDGNVEISVYEAAGPSEELQAAAAIWACKKAKKKVNECRYGLVLERADWEPLGIVESVDQGDTEILSVDSWHRNLKGTKNQFGQLAQMVVEAIWRGENRLRIFPSRQIGAEIAATFCRMNEATNQGVRDLYSGILEKNSWLDVASNPGRITITGALRGFGAEVAISTARLA